MKPQADLRSGFVASASPSTVVFGTGAARDVGNWLDRLDRKRVMLVCTPGQAQRTAAFSAAFPGHLAGVHAAAVMHTPVGATTKAVAVAEKLEADCLVSLGGGSAIGLGKAVAWKTGLPHLAVPTTYSGSEVTPILGQTDASRKITMRDPAILPAVVIYDPELSAGLPVATSIASGLNAMAHALEALYAADRTPITSMLATEGLKAFGWALPEIVRKPSDPEARRVALYGAWLCGWVLGMTRMSLHHKICHALGGSLDTPHAETHAIMLPHTIGFNHACAADTLEPASVLFGADLGGGLWDFASALGSPLSLRELGVARADLTRAVDAAMVDPYANPRPFDRAAIATLLDNAWVGKRTSHQAFRED
ncbi:maleylacetate reductase [Aminobacter sp. MSH1]|uniref:maleylacetate reductase n=1 Tax=Aminobacter sp. MSH1 TaxID=374606 RepID=UPI000D387C1E|nr:maleylacetate reductase [Aminobacter sp. MSH1]